MSNVDVMYSVHFIKMTERSDTILRHSIFVILRFCGSLFLGYVIFGDRLRLQSDSVLSLLDQFLTICPVGFIHPPAKEFNNAAHAHIILKDP